MLLSGKKVHWLEKSTQSLVVAVVSYISYVYSQSHSTDLTIKHSVLPLQTILTNQYACPHVHHSLYDRHPRHYDSAPGYQRLPHALLERRGKQ